MKNINDYITNYWADTTDYDANEAYNKHVTNGTYQPEHYYETVMLDVINAPFSAEEKKKYLVAAWSFEEYPDGSGYQAYFQYPSWRDLIGDASKEEWQEFLKMCKHTAVSEPVVKMIAAL